MSRMKSENTWRLVDPVARRAASAAASPPRAGEESAPRTVAFFTNSKQHALEIESAMARALSEANGIDARFYSKPNASVGASPQMLRDIAKECDAAVVGTGD
jgi:hypothetical protein